MPAYLAGYLSEGEALKLIKESAITDKIIKADIIRDGIFRGMCDSARSAEKHFNAEKKEAALRLRVVFNHFGNVARKGYDEETAAITSLVDELELDHAADTATIGITDWIAELKSSNDAFDDLKTGRYTEESKKTLLRMNEVRVEVDNAYKKVVERINALIVVEGEANYITFVNEMNVRIDSYSKLIAQRKGRNAIDPEVPEAPAALE
jgi:hypothetical protein